MALAFANIMIFAWIPITAFIFSRFAPAKAVVVTLLWGYLFLPAKTGINLPVLPTLDKHLIPGLTALVFYSIAQKKEVRAAMIAARRASAENGGPRKREKSRAGLVLKGHKITVFLVLMLVVSSILTYVTNRNVEVFGPRVLPAMSPYDMLAVVQSTLLLLLPLWLARKAISTREMMVFSLKAFVIAGLVYSVFIIWEARMSPSLNLQIYGSRAHSFAQHIRGGHYRAMVFLEHGLRVGIFMTMSLMAAVVLFRTETEVRKRKQWLLCVLWLFPVLYLSRNTGAFMLSLMFVPLLFVFPIKAQLMLAGALSAIVLIYPLARGADVIPTDSIVAQFEAIDTGRAESLAYRLRNEDILLERAALKPLAGWGGYGRNLIYDRENGASLSVPDGEWIIQIGTRGWVGYLSLFSLLCLPPILLALRSKDASLTLVDSGLCLILVVNLIDLIPNSSLVFHTWFLAGVLWARVGWHVQKVTKGNRSQRRNDSDALQRDKRRRSATVRERAAS